MNLLACAVFAGFVGSLFLVGWTRGRRFAVNLLLVYVLGINALVAAVQIDLWPFSSWPLIATVHPEEASHLRLAVVDSAGVEHPIDARALGSMSYLELTAWIEADFLRLPEQGRASAARVLLDRIERSRSALVTRGAFPPTAAPLGPLTAPRFILTPRSWGDGRAPETALTGLRVYRDTWDPEERDRNPAAVRRELLYEYRGDSR